MSRLGLALALAALALGAACARRTIALPSGAGTPVADYAAQHAEVSKSCAGVRTLTAELGISGRAGDQKLRGRALAGFSAPNAMRLEALAPFGQPAFILAARDADATLLLPRDGRVLRGEPAHEILGALTGIALAPGDLQAILAGCVVPSPKAVAGAQHGGDWRSIDLQGGTRLYLRRASGRWQLRAAMRDGWLVEYPEWQGTWPRRVRLATQGTPSIDIGVEVSQLETNAAIDPAAFRVEVPRDAAPITLAELRDAGPLSGAAPDRQK